MPQWALVSKIAHLRLTFDPYFLYALSVLIQSAADGIVLGGISVIAGFKATVLGSSDVGKALFLRLVPPTTRKERSQSCRSIGYRRKRKYGEFRAGKQCQDKIHSERGFLQEEKSVRARREGASRELEWHIVKEGARLLMFVPISPVSPTRKELF